MDVLRGFALFGIMFINVYALVNPVDWFDVPWQQLPDAQYGMEVVKLLFFQGKFYTLFAILFGLGFAMQLTEAQRKSRQFALRFLWRIVVLWSIGMCHMVFIWNGDILATYAIAGVILLCCYGVKQGIDWCLRRANISAKPLPHYIILVAAFCLIFGPLIVRGGLIYQQAQTVRAHQMGQELSPAQQQFIDKMLVEHSPQHQRKVQMEHDRAQQIYETGSYMDLVKLRISQLPVRYAPSPFWLMVCGLFLIGTFLGRYNYIGRACEYRAEYIKVAIVAFSIGMSANLVFVYLSIIRPNVGGDYWPWVVFFAKTCAGLGMSITFMVLIILGMLGWAKRYLMVFAPVGRMALTNYLTQSIIGTSIYYSYGFNLIGKVNVFGQVGYILSLFVLQTLFCRWWLSRYNFGPAEWLWRSLTYMKLQPMRVEKSKAQQVSTV